MVDNKDYQIKIAFSRIQYRLCSVGFSPFEFLFSLIARSIHPYLSSQQHTSAIVHTQTIHYIGNKIYRRENVARVQNYERIAIGLNKNENPAKNSSGKINRNRTKI